MRRFARNDGGTPQCLPRVRVAPDVVLRVGAYDGRFAIGDAVKLSIAPDAGVLLAGEA
ncbi:hypothetical protein [Methylocystis sp. S23]